MKSSPPTRCRSHRRSPPSNTTPPTITGTVEQGQTLTAVEGTWTNAANRRTWQWLRCDSAGHNCNPISGAEQQTYTLAPEDVGHTLEISETAYNDVGASQPAASRATEVVPTPPPSPPEAQTLPTLTGTLEQSASPDGHPAVWSGEVKHYAYLWKRCDNNGQNCNPISGANETTYVLRGWTSDTRIALKETATNAAGSRSRPRPPPTRSPASCRPRWPLPTVKGTAATGTDAACLQRQLERGTDRYEYRWTSCDSGGEHCETIGGATSKSYVPSGSDVGHRLRVEEIARNGTGAGSPASSAATAQVLPEAPVASASPTITGPPQQGETLTAHAGEVDNSPTGYSLQWLRCEPGECVPVPGATKAEYTLTSADIGSSRGGQGNRQKRGRLRRRRPPNRIRSAVPRRRS